MALLLPFVFLIQFFLTAHISVANLVINIREFFKPIVSNSASNSVCASKLKRRVWESDSGYTCISDSFGQHDIVCVFVRFAPRDPYSVSLVSIGGHKLVSCSAGGWLLTAVTPDEPSYWIPRPAMLRSLDGHGRILSEQSAEIRGIEATGSRMMIDAAVPKRFQLDLVAWRIPAAETELIESLQNLICLETQPVFLWGSHTLYQRPADIYLHLVFGHVYENRYLWPFNRKSCSENDAHSLYVTLSGLQRATGKKLYNLLKDQLLLSVLARQSSDGGWRHGEWSDDMEAHLRLNGGAIHLLMNSLEERDDPVVKQKLERAVGFVSRHKDEMQVGTWLLHDSLELHVEGMKKSPFQWLPSRVLGKSPSNTLVLNTHLDSLVLLDRYRQVTGDERYDELITSAKSATQAVLNLRSFQFLYRILFQLIGLNLLPIKVQMSLPLPLRGLKRLVSKWLIPNLYRITARFPRFVMPGGYIERAIALRGLADPYHSINVMDLARYWRRFPDEYGESLLRDAVLFVKKNKIQDHWEEREEKKYALGFWAEALYHLYLLAPDREKLSYLAEVIFKLQDLAIGLPPSLLGANAEAVPVKSQVASPSLADRHLRIANLSRGTRAEFLVCNPTDVARELSWESTVTVLSSWENSAGEQIANGKVIEIPAREWLIGSGDLTTGLRPIDWREKLRI